MGLFGTKQEYDNNVGESSTGRELALFHLRLCNVKDENFTPVFRSNLVVVHHKTGTHYVYEVLLYTFTMERDNERKAMGLDKVALKAGHLCDLINFEETQETIFVLYHHPPYLQKMLPYLVQSDANALLSAQRRKEQLARQNVRRGAYAGTVFGDGHGVSEPLALEPLRVIHVVRDPRDVLVSGYFYHLKTKEKWVKGPKGLQQQLLAFKGDKELGLAKEMKSQWFVNYMKGLAKWEQNTIVARPVISLPFTPDTPLAPFPSPPCPLQRFSSSSSSSSSATEGEEHLPTILYSSFQYEDLWEQPLSNWPQLYACIGFPTFTMALQWSILNFSGGSLAGTGTADSTVGEGKKQEEDVSSLLAKEGMKEGMKGGIPSWFNSMRDDAHSPTHAIKRTGHPGSWRKHFSDSLISQFKDLYAAELTRYENKET